MKNLIYLLLLFVLTQVVSAQNIEEAKRYAIKSGYVKYSLTGSVKGIKTLYWDNYGEKTREEIESKTEVKMFGMTNTEETHTLTITNGNQYWSIDLIEKTGHKGTMETYELGKELAQNMTEAEAKKLEEDIMSALNGQKLGQESFMGKSCEVYEVMGAKSWIYKGVVLKTTAKMMGIEANETAIDFSENLDVNENRFKPVSDIDYQETDDLTNPMFNLN